MARVYQAMAEAGMPQPRQRWSVFSFRPVLRGDQELMNAAGEAQVPVPVPPVYRFHLYRHGQQSAVPGKVRLRRVRILEEILVFAANLTLLMKRGNGPWRAV